MENFKRKFKLDGVLMKSANGTIYDGRVRKTNQTVVIKEFPKKTVSEYFYWAGNRIPSEIHFHFRAYALDPTTVVQPYDWAEDKNSFFIAMEKPPGWIDLFEFCNRYGSQPENIAKVVIEQLVKCLDKLLTSGICHMDIKDENILINQQTLEIKIIDFGCAQNVKNVYTRCRGTPHYWPPEWFQNKAYRPEPLTVWSLGPVIYLLLCGEWKFVNGAHVRNHLKEFQLSPQAQKLINSVLCPHDSSRITLKNILRCSWLKKPSINF